MHPSCRLQRLGNNVHHFKHLLLLKTSSHHLQTYRSPVVELCIIVRLNASIDVTELSKGLHIARLVKVLVRRRHGEGTRAEVWGDLRVSRYAESEVH